MRALHGPRVVAEPRGISEFDHFGSGRYARQDLVAQITSAMLCAESGIDNEALQADDLAYRNSWATVLKDDPKMIVTAASQAQKAADLICEPSRELARKPRSRAGAPGMPSRTWTWRPPDALLRRMPQSWLAGRPSGRLPAVN